MITAAEAPTRLYWAGRREVTPLCIQGSRSQHALLFDDWCDTYNRQRPHSALGYLPPTVFAAAFNQPELS